MEGALTYYVHRIRQPNGTTKFTAGTTRGRAYGALIMGALTMALPRSPDEEAELDEHIFNRLKSGYEEVYGRG